VGAVTEQRPPTVMVMGDTVAGSGRGESGDERGARQRGVRDRTPHHFFYDETKGVFHAISGMGEEDKLANRRKGLG